MEIERKFLIQELPNLLEQYPSHLIEQAYLCTNPVVRIRRQDDDYILTYKGEGMMTREEYNLPITAEAYAHLLTKIDGNLIRKRRYLIPAGHGLTIELDIFSSPFASLRLAEVEFPDEKAARAFVPPAWFGEDVTFDGRYHNSYLSTLDLNGEEKGG
ncbi:MAG: CYTH domain-containing protein [Eubacteriales bacterium]|nr:CYTH domain-containing protein [Eubacteriales bacterium]